MSLRIAVIGVPSSAGAFAPGQEQAPDALRAAGLTDMLMQAGLEVADHGNSETWRWRPDRHNIRAQNLEKVTEIALETATRVQSAAADSDVTLVLGGDCTVGIGSVAGHVAAGRRVGLLYFDTHADLNVPSSVTEGALDWMGLAHMIGRPGAADTLVGAGPRTPLLEPDQIILFAWGPEQSTAFERETIAAQHITTIPVERVSRDPRGAASEALRILEARCECLLVHFDVDVIDFTDTPLSENWGRNEGLSFSDATSALTVVLGSPKLAGVTVTELNPDHVEPGTRTLERLIAAVAAGLAASAVARA